MRGLGVSERRVRLERDAWILERALDPQAVPRRLREKNAAFDDLDAWDIAHEQDGGPSHSRELLVSRISEASPARGAAPAERRSGQE
ncbi:hypothetical protein HNR02_006569 [Amycolatopsis endophytica]|uniref:Uncharacterized protein n=2 Tax=Amycolatopsis endophytica TaxID=860233 RepID=A0A853BEL1_9PSEU|nr:hypothetical protein [Amycolatopsis endophytica]